MDQSSWQRYACVKRDRKKWGGQYRATFWLPSIQRTVLTVYVYLVLAWLAGHLVKRPGALNGTV